MKSHVESISVPPCPFTERARALCRGELDEPSAIQIEQHLADCPSCGAVVDAMLESSDGVIQSLSSLPPTADDEQEYRTLAERLLAAQLAGDTASGGFVPLRLANPPIGPLPQTLGNYELLACIGRGAWGAVYRARHTKLDQIVAVKVLDSSRICDGQAVDRFLQEMRAAGQLHHRNVVRATDAGEDRGFHYLVMEFVDGVDAGRLVQARGPLEVRDACEIVRQAAAALDFAHQRAWVHRDVKPSNVMVGRDGVVKLLDLGIAGKHGGIAGRHGGDGSIPLPLGTAEYMAPEQWQNFAAVDARADVFGLGCTLFRLLTGKLPYDGSPKTVLASAGMSIRAAELVEEYTIPRGLAKALERMLALQPENRSGSAAEIEGELANWSRPADLPALVAEVCGGPRRPAVNRGVGLKRITRRQILAAGATAASAVLLLRWALSESAPRLRRNVWRDLAPVAPMLVAVDPDAQFECDFQKPSRITMTSSDLALVHLGRSVSGMFSVNVHLQQEGTSPNAGLFFQGHFREDDPQVFEFQSLELQPEITGSGSANCRIQWSRWNLFKENEKLTARCDPWGSAEVEFLPGANGDEFVVTLGRRGCPEVAWNGRPVADSSWEFSAEGRRQVNRTPIQVQRQTIGRLGLVNRSGATEFHAPRLMYL
jgi:hypothetical protein